jgi:hypothetical protein
LLSPILSPNSEYVALALKSSSVRSFLSFIMTYGIIRYKR